MKLKDLQVGCERPDGLLNIHSADKDCEVCRVATKCKRCGKTSSANSVRCGYCGAKL